MIILIKNKFKLFGTSMTIGIISVPLASILVGSISAKTKCIFQVLLSLRLFGHLGLPTLQPCGKCY